MKLLMIFHTHCLWVLSIPRATLMTRFVIPEQQIKGGMILLQFVFVSGVLDI